MIKLNINKYLKFIVNCLLVLLLLLIILKYLYYKGLSLESEITDMLNRDCNSVRFRYGFAMSNWRLEELKDSVVFDTFQEIYSLIKKNKLLSGLKHYEDLLRQHYIKDDILLQRHMNRLVDFLHKHYPYFTFFIPVFTILESYFVMFPFMKLIVLFPYLFHIVCLLLSVKFIVFFIDVFYSKQ